MGWGFDSVAPSYRSQRVVHIMTTDYIADDEIASQSEFEAALGQVILSALNNQVDPSGTWEYRTDDATMDTEVLIVELAE